MTYDEIRALFERGRAQGLFTSQFIDAPGGGSGGDAGPASGSYWQQNPNEVGVDGMTVRFDPQTGQYTVAQGDMDSGGIQRYAADQNGVRDLGFEAPRSFGDKLQNAARNAAPYLAGMAGLGLGAAYLPSLLGGGGAAGGAAGGISAADAAAVLGGAETAAAVPAAVAPAAAAAGGAAAGAAPALAAGNTLGSLTSYLPYGAAALSGIAGANASREAGQVQADAATRAADSTLQATRESNQLLRDMYNTSRADNQPWVDAGRTALSSLTAGTAPGGEFMQRFDASRMYDDPGYAFRLGEGEKAINRAASAGGRYFGGQTLRDLTRFGQDYASGEYGNAYNRFTNDQTSRFNRLSSLAGTGQTATRDNNAAGQGMAQQAGQNSIAGANNAGNLRTSGAAARASGYVGATNALTGAVGQGLNYAQSSSLMDLLARRG